MPRTSRMVVPETKTAYHVIFRTALDGFPFGDVDERSVCNDLKKIQQSLFC